LYALLLFCVSYLLTIVHAFFLSQVSDQAVIWVTSPFSCVPLLALLISAFFFFVRSGIADYCNRGSECWSSLGQSFEARASDLGKLDTFLAGTDRFSVIDYEVFIPCSG
jgi:hypothetical protein